MVGPVKLVLWCSSHNRRTSLFLGAVCRTQPQWKMPSRPSKSIVRGESVSRESSEESRAACSRSLAACFASARQAVLHWHGPVRRTEPNQDPRQFVGIEPNAMFFAQIDDHSAAVAKLSVQHQFAAHGARTIANVHREAGNSVSARAGNRERRAVDVHPLGAAVCRLGRGTCH